MGIADRLSEYKEYLIYVVIIMAGLYGVGILKDETKIPGTSWPLGYVLVLLALGALYVFYMFYVNPPEPQYDDRRKPQPIQPSEEKPKPEDVFDGMT